MYMTLFIFSDTDCYAAYRPTLAAIDTVMFSIATFGMIYYRSQWSLESIVTYSTVVTLNILTEFDSRFPVESYLELYENIIKSHFLIMIVFFLSNRKNNDNSNNAIMA